MLHLSPLRCLVGQSPITAALSIFNNLLTIARTQGPITPTAASVSEVPLPSIINEPLGALEGGRRRGWGGGPLQQESFLRRRSFSHSTNLPWRPQCAGRQAGRQGQRKSACLGRSRAAVTRQEPCARGGACACLQPGRQPRCFLISDDESTGDSDAASSPRSPREGLFGPDFCCWRESELLRGGSRFRKWTAGWAECRTVRQTAWGQVPAGFCAGPSPRRACSCTVIAGRCLSHRASLRSAVCVNSLCKLQSATPEKLINNNSNSASC